MSLEQLLASIPPGSHDETLARQVNFDRLPAHVAIIMDGNGRWAAQRHLPRVEGHRAGIDSVRDVVETSARLGIDVLTLYAFSVENWKRPRAEVNTLMMLLKRYIRLELGTLLKNNIQFKVIGRPEELSVDVRRELEIGVRQTEHNTGMQFNIALNYGGRAEIVDAARRAIRRVPVHRGPARSRSADSDQRRDAREQFPALADRLRRDLGHRNAVARLPPARSPRVGARLPEARSTLRRHQAVAGGARRQVKPSSVGSQSSVKRKGIAR
jgi:undecaprenyl diphosphate synthase